jgi:SAM-dependent methyltransferase
MEKDRKIIFMIDRSLNYGRSLILKFLKSAGKYLTVLDIGAGHGDDLMLAKEVNPKAVLHAIELHPEYVHQLAQKSVIVHPINIEKDPFPFPDGSMDLIIANQVLEHTKEVFWIFHEVSRTLPVGGHFILGVPNLAAFHNRVLLAVGRQPSPIKTHSAHVRGFTKGDILRFLESCFPGGYKLRAFAGSNFYPFPALIARPAAWMFPTLAWGIFFLFEKRREYKSEFLDFPVNEQLETNFHLGRSGG